MKDIIIDTDIGIDCDDAVALASAIYLNKKGKINILGVSTCARDNATASVSAIAKYYGVDIPVAKSTANKLVCDKTDNYATKLKEAFKSKQTNEDAVKFLREKLANAKNKVTLIAIGPLNVIANLLQSQADEISPLNGIDLVKEKVEVFHTMAGNFVKYDEKYNQKWYKPEWNVEQDIKAAQIVIDKMPVETVLCPWEIGKMVLSGETFSKNSPVGLAIKSFYENNREVFPGRYARESWDPITIFAAAGEDVCAYSGCGRVTIDDEGYTTFTPDRNGKHRYLKHGQKPSKLAKKLNHMYAELEEMN